MIQDIINAVSEDTQSVLDYYDSLYDKTFKIHFDEVQKLYLRFESSKKPITDDELEEILTSLPLELFSVSEKLNSLRLSLQVVKLKSKDKNNKDNKEEYTLLTSIYASVIERVENQVSFSRELIMSAKKIWDSRKHSENVNPVAPIHSELPEYPSSHENILPHDSPNF